MENSNHRIYWSRKRTEALKVIDTQEQKLLLGSEVAKRLVINDSLASDIGEAQYDAREAL